MHRKNPYRAGHRTPIVRSARWDLARLTSLEVFFPLAINL
jgi:hypothetical protein